MDSLTEREATLPLPHPAVSVALFLPLESAVAEAWRILHTSSKEDFDPASAWETDFTSRLHEILEDRLLDSETVAGFTRDVFTGIERPERRNFDGTKTGKKPDMVAKLADRPNVKRTQDGIFIECKPVDAKHSLLGDYCDEGIARFVIGDYAWAMTEALMVGYNTVHEKPSEALKPPFGKRTKQIRKVGKLLDCQQTANDPPVAISWHKRSFRLRGKQAPNIMLRHLWLQRENNCVDEAQE